MINLQQGLACAKKHGPHRPKKDFVIQLHRPLSPRVKRMVDRHRKETAEAAEAATKARMAQSSKSKFAALNETQMRHAQSMQDKILVLLGSLAKQIELQKRVPVLGSRQECIRESRQILRASKLALVRKYRQKGISLLGQGLNLQALFVLHHAIRLKKQSSTLPQPLRQIPKPRSSRLNDNHDWANWNDASSLSRTGFNISTTLSSDLQNVELSGQQTKNESLNSRHGGISQNSYQSTRPLIKGNVRNITSRTKKSCKQLISLGRECKKKRDPARLVPSFFTALPQRPQKWTPYRDPRRDPRYII